MTESQTKRLELQKREQKSFHQATVLNIRYILFLTATVQIGVLFIFNFITEIINIWCVLILNLCTGKCGVHLQVKYFINIVSLGIRHADHVAPSIRKSWH
jgi:hypothetical protein